MAQQLSHHLGHQHPVMECLAPDLASPLLSQRFANVHPDKLMVTQVLGSLQGTQIELPALGFGQARPRHCRYLDSEAAVGDLSVCISSMVKIN